MNNNDFDIEGLRKDKKIHFHVDIALLDAPVEIQEKTIERAKENEKDFYNVVRHYGAGHDMIVKDPRTIIADILRYIKF